MSLSLPSFRALSHQLALLLGLAWASPVLAQAPETHCLLLPLDPVRRVQQSALIIEAEVLDARSFWDAVHGRLFTRHRLRVFALLKGQVADTAGLQLITEGGRLGLDQQLLTNTLRLQAGQQGVFFLRRAPWPALAGSGTFTPSGSEQGFIEYHLADGTASEPFRTYPAVDAAFYEAITRFTGQPRRVLQANRALEMGRPAAQRGTLAPVIAGFTPARLPAGVGAVLTIDGDGFGGSRGSGFVEFKNADDGGATRVKARETDYLAWTNTRIQVRVPSSANGGQPASNGHPAGSGPVRVTTSDQLATESAASIVIPYALTNVESTVGALLQRPNHVALNTTGGLSFRFGPNFTANPAPPAAFQRAVATWRCQTGMNWEVGSPNPSNVIADDNQNVVAFDVGAELPDRVLGRTTTYYRGCFAPGGEVVFSVKEIDMQFDDGAVFQFGPGPPIAPQVDFETVAVHELGHAQQLAHLILPGAVMHFAVARGQNTRALNRSSDVAGGRQVLRVRSFRNLGCGGPAMLPAPLTGLSARFDATTGSTLIWTTRDECFLSGFVVERSLGSDTTAWEAVGAVAVRPPASQYQFTDARPPGGLRYYRLRLARPDGTLDSAAPVALSTEANVSIFPNPVSGDQLRLQYPAAAEGAVTFRLFDMLGRQTRAVVLPVRPGLNILELNAGGLAPGLYVLRWQDAQSGRGSQKFVRL